MAEMLTYSQSLTSMTGGRGDYHMAFARYEEVPTHVAQKVMAEAEKGRGQGLRHRLTHRGAESAGSGSGRLVWTRTTRPGAGWPSTTRRLNRRCRRQRRSQAPPPLAPVRLAIQGGSSSARSNRTFVHGLAVRTIRCSNGSSSSARSAGGRAPRAGGAPDEQPATALRQRVGEHERPLLGKPQGRLVAAAPVVQRDQAPVARSRARSSSSVSGMLWRQKR